MDRLVFSKIIELTILNKSLGSNNSFKWKVGSSLYINKQEVICSRIEQDLNGFYFDNQNRWLVYVKVPGKDHEMMIAAYENAMVEIKMDVSELFSL